MAKRKPRPAFAAKPVAPPDIKGTPIEMPVAMPTRRKRKSKRDLDLSLADAYRATFFSPQGECVKADLMLRANVYHEITGGDLFTLGVQEGMRRMALHITKMLGLTAEHFPTEAWKEAAVADGMMMA